MGLPKISIIFQTKATSAIKRSERGIVALIIKDDTAGGKPLDVFKSIADVDFTKFTQRNYEYIKMAFEGVPNKVIVCRIAVAAANYNTALQTLKNLKWNYLSVPGAVNADIATLATWIKEQRINNKKTFKAVLPKNAADHEGIINFSTDNIKSTLSTTTFTCNEYCARIAGMLAGLSLARSSTYYALNDIISCDLSADPDTDINAGKFIIIYDGEYYKVGRGVNSLTTFTTAKGKDFSKIKIVEGVDLYTDDIRDTFDKYYIGKYINDYDSKQAFVAAVNAYNRTLEGDVLDKSYDNETKIDVQTQKLYLESNGTDTSAMDKNALARANTGSEVFLIGKIKFVDAMEDLTMVNNM